MFFSASSQVLAQGYSIQSTQKMINLILYYFTCIVGTVLNLFYIFYTLKKCLGMQTLYDRVLVNALIFRTLEIWTYALFCTLDTFVLSIHWIPWLAKLLIFILNISLVNANLSLMSIAIAKYIIVFHGVWIQQFQDTDVIRGIRIANVFIATVLVFWDFGFTSSIDVETSFETEHTLEYVPSVMNTFYFIIIAFLILHVRLEIKSYKYSEGTIIQFKR